MGSVFTGLIYLLSGSNTITGIDQSLSSWTFTNKLLGLRALFTTGSADPTASAPYLLPAYAAVFLLCPAAVLRGRAHRRRGAVPPAQAAGVTLQPGEALAR